MVSYNSKFIAAAVQAEPVYLNVDATIDKSIRMIEDAANTGARLIAFPECWLPGYPQFIWISEQQRAYSYYIDYHENCLELGDDRMRRIQRAAERNNIAVVMGYSEKEGGSRYIAQVMIDENGEIVGNRRKLKPTHTERSLFGEGSGIDLFTHDFSFGRLGALSCWEHFQPLNKHLMYSLGEQIHVASWPAMFAFREKVFQFGVEANDTVTRSYAIEGQVFVVASSQMIGQHTMDFFCDTDERRSFLAGADGKTPMGGGWSRIYGPDGVQLAEPLPETEEGIIYGEIDLSQIILAKGAADPVGHYARPDVLSLNFDNRDHRSVRRIGANGESNLGNQSRLQTYRQNLLQEQAQLELSAMQREALSGHAPRAIDRVAPAALEAAES